MSEPQQQQQQELPKTMEEEDEEEEKDVAGVGVNGAIPTTALNPQEVERMRLDVPTEWSLDEYRDLLHELRGSSSSEEWKDEWLQASRYNEIDMVRAILHVHPELLYHQDPVTHNTALHMAAANGHVDILCLLLHVEQDQLEQQQAKVLQSPTEKEDDKDDGDKVDDEEMDVSSLSLSLLLMHRVNNAGNTALHWAASQGCEEAVRVLVQQPHVDVLWKNAAGRSVLTEGFASGRESVVALLLEHESATEERLLQTTTGGNNGNGPANTANDTATATTTSDITKESDNSVTHHFQFGPPQRHMNDASELVEAEQNNKGIRVKIRELAMARSQNDAILGQEENQDTTGLGIWASSLVMAQWMADLILQGPQKHHTTNTTNVFGDQIVLELGAGCGVPGLTIAASATILGQPPPKAVYLTDFHPTTVSNLQYNIQLNNNTHNNHHHHHHCQSEAATDAATASVTAVVQACHMNWHDKSTWPCVERVDVLIGSDLVYQKDMAETLIQTILQLQPRRFLYGAATAIGRCGHDEFIAGLASVDPRLTLHSQTAAPTRYTINPLVSGDDEDCFVHFHELSNATTTDAFTLYDFRWQDDTTGTAN